MSWTMKPDHAAVEARLRVFAAELQAEGHDPAMIVEAMVSLAISVGATMIGPGAMARCLSELAGQCLDVAEQQQLTAAVSRHPGNDNEVRH